MFQHLKRCKHLASVIHVCYQVVYEGCECLASVNHGHYQVGYADTELKLARILAKNGKNPMFVE